MAAPGGGGFRAAQRQIEVTRGMKLSGSPGKRAGRRVGCAYKVCGGAGRPRTQGEAMGAHGWDGGDPLPAGTTQKGASGDGAVTRWLVTGARPKGPGGVRTDNQVSWEP